MEFATPAGASSQMEGIGAVPSTSSVCVRPIDLVHLARYTMGNKALEREILDLFVGQSRVTLERLTAATTDKEWRDQAHALLGSARAVGAKRVAERVLAAQRLAGAHNSPGRDAALIAISAEIDAANAYIRDLFPDE